MKRKIILAALAVGALIAAGAAYAVVAHTTSASQTIAACVAPDGGMRLAPTTGDCKKNESVITWNMVGPAGLNGAAGQNGLNGQNGQNGQNGKDAVDPNAAAGTITVTGAHQGKFADGVAISAVSHEIISPRDAGSGLPTGKRQHKPLTITMEVGASTPQLLNALVTNEVLTSVVLTVGAETTKLTNAEVSDYQLHGGTATFSFTYQKIEWTVGTTSVQDDWEALAP
jgi:type VI secretion system secreted protein Hcp